MEIPQEVNSSVGLFQYTYDTVVVITGSSSGIGECLAYEFAKRGCRLVLAARTESKLKEVAIKCQELGSTEVLIVRTDVSSVDDCKSLINQTISTYGRLDSLVLNAGLASHQIFADTNFEVMEKINANKFLGIYLLYKIRFTTP